MPYYCTVPQCTSMAGRLKNVSFHQFPRNEGLARTWNKILKRNRPYTKYSKVCSLHFTPADYTVGVRGTWKTLRKNALPSRNLPTGDVLRRGSRSPRLDVPRRSSQSPQQDVCKRGSRSPPEVVQNVNENEHIQRQFLQALHLQLRMIWAWHIVNQTSAVQGQQVSEVSDSDQSSNEGKERHERRERASDRRLMPELPRPPLQPLPNPAQPSTSKAGLPNIQPSNRCDECMKCFKDPDVLIIHRRIHGKSTLEANPMLANLLNKPTEMDAMNVENQLKAVAVSMQAYLKLREAQAEGGAIETNAVAID